MTHYFAVTLIGFTRIASMKLRDEDIIRSQDTSPLQLFTQGMRADRTRDSYTRTLRRIMCEILEDVLEGDFESRVKEFVQRTKDDPDWTLRLLLSLSWKLRERTELPKEDADYLNPSTIPGYFKPVKKLFDMNSVSIPWKRIYATYPEKDNILDTKGWTKEDVAAMLKHTRNSMDRALVLVLASSGVRLGGLDLKWGDLTPVYLEEGRLTADPAGNSKVACVALNVYAGSPDNYTAFITPEAYRAILEYGRTWANLMTRQPGPEDHLFLTANLPPHKASKEAIAKRVRQMATKAGLRDPDSKKGSRFETQLVHGFRKFFNKTCRVCLSGDSLASLIRAEYMMGHKGLAALDQNYFKTNMLEMAAEYVKAVPDLTIDDSERLKRSNQRMAANIQKMESEKDDKIARLEKKVNSLKNQMGLPVSKALALIKESSVDEPATDKVVQSLDDIMERIKISQDAAIQEMTKKYDAKINYLLRTIKRMADEKDLGYDPLAEYDKDDKEYEQACDAARRLYDQNPSHYD